MVLSSRNDDPGCLSRIRIPDPDPAFLSIPDPGSRGQKGTGSQIPDPGSATLRVTKQKVVVVWLEWKAALGRTRRDHLPHCNENPIDVFPEKELRSLSPNFHIRMSVSDLYISIFGSHIFLKQNKQTDCGSIF